MRTLTRVNFSGNVAALLRGGPPRTRFWLRASPAWRPTPPKTKLGDGVTTWVSLQHDAPNVTVPISTSGRGR